MSQDPCDHGRGRASQVSASRRRRAAIQDRQNRPTDLPWTPHGSPEAWQEKRLQEVRELARTYYRNLGSQKHTEDGLQRLFRAYGLSDNDAWSALFNCFQEVVEERAA